MYYIMIIVANVQAINLIMIIIIIYWVGLMLVIFYLPQEMLIINDP